MVKFILVDFLNIALTDFAMKSGSQESVLNHLAEDLKQLVLEDNERFHDELRQWDQEQIKRQRIPKNSQEMGIRTESRGTSIKGLPVGQESVHGLFLSFTNE